MKKLFAITAILLATSINVSAAPLPLEQVKNILDLTKTSWLGYRDYDGKQLIYFTHLEAWKCGIKQVQYSLNSAALDKIWQLDSCDPKTPNAVRKDMPYLSLKLNSVQNVSVQLTYDDDTTSEIIEFVKP